MLFKCHYSFPYLWQLRFEFFFLLYRKSSRTLNLAFWLDALDGEVGPRPLVDGRASQRRRGPNSGIDLMVNRGFEWNFAVRGNASSMALHLLWVLAYSKQKWMIDDTVLSAAPNVPTKGLQAPRKQQAFLIRCLGIPRHSLAIFVALGVGI